MITRILCLCCLLFLSAQGRENPFTPYDAAAEQAKKGKTGLSDSPSSRRALSSKKIINFQHIRFIVMEKQVLIETKDKLRRDFTLKHPPRIVLDFFGSTDFPPRFRVLEVSVFQKLKMAKHKGYYRVVFETEQKQPYKVSPYKYGYMLTLE